MAPTMRLGVVQAYLLPAFRWAVITNWFLVVLAGVLVGSSLMLSYHTDAWHWFQRSGALAVSIGAILSTRRPLRLMIETMMGDTTVPQP